MLKLHPISNTLVVIAGPTASGKTNLSVAIAKHFNSEIISADSRQFYREIPVGTAAPSLDLQKKIKHHFIGNLSVIDEYNASKYEQDVLELLKQSFQKRPVMMLVGGSGLYIDAVCNGIDELPDSNVKNREYVHELFEEKGLNGLRSELKKIDPEYFTVVDINNPVRLMRAIEVCMQTGKKYSELRLNIKKQRDFKIIKIALEVPRAVLIQRINQRTDDMIASGWIDEAKSVLQFKHLNPLNTVGYKELFKFIEGEWTLEEAVEKIKTNTRRYAKRQMTWFKKDNDYKWFSPDDEVGIIQFINEKLCF
ncbi:MAG TPA: tRNA (adenosine(37)-N6)-dimethylallyltransferase MiaA [Bacteroidales bacterium]